MLKSALRGLLQRRTSLATSLLAIVLGTAFIGGSLLFTQMLNAAYQGIMLGSVADVNVRPDTGGRANLTAASTLSEDDIDRVARVAGVRAAEGTITSSEATLLGANGRPLNEFAPGLGMNWHDGPAAGGRPGWTVIDGRAPAASDEVAIDPDSLVRSGLALGDKVEIVTGNEDGAPVSKRLVGTVLYGSQGSAGGASFALFTTKEAQALFMQGEPRFNGIWVAADSDQDPLVLAKAVDAVVPPGFDALSSTDLADELQGQFRPFLDTLNGALLGLAGISLVVGCFLIFNTFSILVAQRAGQLALYRSLGASRAQILASTLGEALILGIVGSVMGLGGGWGVAALVRWLMAAFAGMDFGSATMGYSVPIVAITVVVGTLVTVAAGFVPALRASQADPVDVMRQSRGAPKSLGPRPVAVALVLLLVGVALVCWAALGAGPGREVWLVTGALLQVVSLTLLSPWLGRPLIDALGWGGARLIGAPARLARLNLTRNASRTAVAATALMVGLASIAAIGTFAASSRAGMEASLRSGLAADFIIQDPRGRPFAPGIATEAADTPGVESVHAWQLLPALVGDEAQLVVSLEPSAIGGIQVQRFVQGAADAFSGRTVIVEEQHARDAGIRVGDELEVQLTQTPVRLRVVGIVSTVGDSIANFMVPAQLARDLDIPKRDSMLGVAKVSGAERDAVRAGLDRVIDKHPLLVVADQDEYASVRAAPMEQLLSMVYGLLLFAVIIAVLGIVNTLSLSVIERRRELAMLRAVGFTRGDVRWMIVAEGIMVALLGGAFGLALGVFLGWGFLGVMDSAVDRTFSLPGGILVACLLLSVAAGALGGLLPAHQASRAPVAQATADP